MNELICKLRAVTFCWYDCPHKAYYHLRELGNTCWCVKTTCGRPSGHHVLPTDENLAHTLSLNQDELIESHLWIWVEFCMHSLSFLKLLLTALGCVYNLMHMRFLVHVIPWHLWLLLKFLHSLKSTRKGWKKYWIDFDAKKLKYFSSQEVCEVKMFSLDCVVVGTIAFSCTIILFSVSKTKPLKYFCSMV